MGLEKLEGFDHERPYIRCEGIWSVEAIQKSQTKKMCDWYELRRAPWAWLGWQDWGQVLVAAHPSDTGETVASEPRVETGVWKEVGG